MADLIKLARPIRHEADVARLKTLLATLGYDANDLDIQEAWHEWSEDYDAVSWRSVSDVDEFVIDHLKAMLSAGYYLLPVQ